MSDTQNVHKVKDVMENDFPLSLNELYCLNKEVASLLPEDEKTLDQEQWFESKMASIKEFMKATKTWIAAVHEGSMRKLTRKMLLNQVTVFRSMVPVMLDTTIRTDLT